MGEAGLMSKAKKKKKPASFKKTVKCLSSEIMNISCGGSSHPSMNPQSCKSINPVITSAREQKV